MVPEEVLVVYNSRVIGSYDIAKRYLKARSIPSDQLVETSVTTKEVVNRKEFEERILTPVRKRIASLEKKGRHIYGIVLAYGMPLKVLPPELDDKNANLLKLLKREQAELKKESSEAVRNENYIKNLKRRIDTIAGTNKRASVDSELMLVKKDNYPLKGWVLNPYFIGAKGVNSPVTKEDVVMVARIDGPDRNTAKRLITDVLEVEKDELKGKAFFDARWGKPEKTENLSGYALYDYSLHRASERVSKKIETELDAEAELFSEGLELNTALYCGWYSYGKYIDSFNWSKGAIGYHIASAECSTLKRKGSTVWCPQMLINGAAATIGPVYEPYVQGFPLPEIFFGLLIDGDFSLGEAYLLSLPYISWQMVLIGDPLYKPFMGPAVK